MSKSRSEFLVFAIDIGTSSTRSALFDHRGRRLRETTASEAYRVTYDPDGKAELSPDDLLGAVTRTRESALRSYHSRPARRRLPILAIGGSALWHGLLGLDRQLRPITPVFTWADSRSVLDARRLREELDEKKIQLRTGCMLRSTFWPAKLRWLRRSDPRLFRRVAYWVSPSDWLFSSLFGQLRTSESMASATGLFNLKTRTWDEKLIDKCGIKLTALPCITDRLEVRSKDKAKCDVFCPIGDGAAGNLGSGANEARIAAINVGTSGAVRIINATRTTVRKLPTGLFCYVVDSTQVILGGATSNAGNLRQWALGQLRINNTSQAMERLLAREAAANDPLTVLPFWVRERAPTWPEGQPGVIAGLSQATTAPQITRASLTATYYRLGQILDKLEHSLGRMKRIIVSGGILHSRASLNLLADALGRDLEISAEPEASLRGAAVHVLNQLGVKVKTPRSGKIVKHDPSLSKRHRQRRKRQIELEEIAQRWIDFSANASAARTDVKPKRRRRS